MKTNEHNNCDSLDLIKSYIDGDKNAITTLIECYSKRVKDYVTIMVRDSQIADDIVQETFIRVVEGIDSGKYINSGRFMPWVLRIAHNQTIDYFRKNKSHSKVSETEAEFNILNTQQFSEANIEERMINSQTQQELMELISLLPKEQREIIELRFFEGLSFRKIAQITGVSINTALGRIRYAIMNLRKMSDLIS